MSRELSSEPKLKRQRIMIISGDDNVMDEIRKIKDISLCKSIVLDTLDEDVQVTAKNQRKSKDGPLTCVICGSTANGYNFDVISCESCKSFFRRNALRTPVG